jgi:hypothetical protein
MSHHTPPQMIRCSATSQYRWRYVAFYAGPWEYVGAYPYGWLRAVGTVEEAIVTLLRMAPTTPEIEAYVASKEAQSTAINLKGSN